MDPEQLRGVVQAAIDNALDGQAAANLQKEREFRQIIDALTSQVAELRAAPTTSRSSAPTPEIKVCAAIEIIDSSMTSSKEQRRQQDRNFSQTDPQLGINKNPYYTKQVKAQVHSDLRNNKLESRPEPMEVDPSAKVCIPAQAPPYQNRRPATSERTPRKQQRVNHVTQSSDQEGKSYANAASSAIAEINDDAICEYDSDVVHFLGENPCCLSSDEE